MSLSALLCAQSLPIRIPLSTTKVIDEVLFNGDAMYRDAFENHVVPDTETLSLNYLPNRAQSSTEPSAVSSSHDSCECSI